MKKFMRIALVFALAGAALMYTGCTKDYSGDISDLNKKVSEQSTTLSALQTQVAAAQTTANEALEAAKKADDKAAIAELETRVKALEDAQAKIDAVVEQIKKDTKADVEKALAEIKAEVEALIAQVGGDFSVAATDYNLTATFAYAVWAPQTDSRHVGWYNKLATEFPELAEIKKNDEITMFGALPFIVNPSTVAFDDTYTFSLVNKFGENTGIVLGNPTPGYVVKAGTNVWNVEVQSPAYNEAGEPVYNKTISDLSLVVENADGVSAQTAFAYSVRAYKNGGTMFKLGAPDFNTVQYHDETYFDGDVLDLKDLGITDTEDERNRWFPWLRIESAPLYEDYFIIEATDAAQIEKYGVSVDGTKVTIAKGPEAGDGEAELDFTITAIGVNGQTDQVKFTITVESAAIEANAELAAKEITLAAKDNFVKYDVADFGFSALEWSEVFTALKKDNSGKFAAESKDYKANGDLIFFGKDGKKLTSTTFKYSDVAAFGFELAPANTLPGTYDVTITDGKVFKGVGTLVVSNPEACPIKLAEKLCDADGVLQIVRDVTTDGYITYNLANAIVTTTDAALVANTFVDEDREFTDDWSWVTTDRYTFKIPVWDEDDEEEQLLYTPRTFSVTYKWFNNSKNTDTFYFKAEAVSAIYDEAGEGANITIDDTKTTAYFKPDAAKKESKTINLKEVLKNGKYVAGEEKGTEFTGFFEIQGGSSTKENQNNYSKPDSAKVTSAIEHTNLTNGSYYVKNADSTFVEMPLDDAVKMGLIDASQHAAYAADPAFKFYISTTDWGKVYKTWSTYYNQAATTDGNFDLQADVTAQQIAALTGTNKAIVTKFAGYAAKIAFTKDLQVTAKTTAKSRCSDLAADPTFKIDTNEYGKYATIDLVKCTITASATHAGQSDVTIPVTAEIKDIWGMTTKKTFNVVLKVK